MLKKEWKLIVTIFFSSLLLYLFTINRCCSIVLDSMCYIADIAKNDLVFHPHHLVYHALFYYWSKFMLLFGISDIVFAIPTINALFGSLTLVIIYMIFRVRFELSKMQSIMYLLLPAFSFGFWIVSTSVNVYAAPLTFLMLCFYLYLDNKQSRQKWLLIGVFHSIAIIFNEWNIFIFLIIISSIIFSVERKVILKKYILYYLIPLSVITGGAYLTIIMGYYGINTLNGIYKWMTYYSGIYQWSSVGLTAVKQAVMGIGQTISAPYWLFKSDIFRSIFHSTMQGTSFAEELYFCRNINSTEATINLILLVSVIVLIAYLAFGLMKNLKKTYLSNKKVVTYLSLWIIIPSIMPFFWSGYNQRYWFTQTVVFFIFTALTAKNFNLRKKKQNNIITCIVIILLFVINFFGVFVPSTNRENDLIYKKIEPIAKTAKKGDVVIYNNIWTFGFYVDTYIPGAIELNFGFLTNDTTLRKAENVLENIDITLKTNDIYMLEDVLNETKDYPKEINTYLEVIKSKYGIYMKRYQTHYITYYKLSKSIENENENN